MNGSLSAVTHDTKKQVNEEKKACLDNVGYYEDKNICI